jgi:F420-dependent methylenetetrahydromethanopterin dehydrogenase
VEDSMPIADAHELLEAQAAQFAREIEKANRA